MPYLFAASAASAAGGMGMLAVSPRHSGLAVRFAMLGAATELTARAILIRRLGETAEPYQRGRPGAVMRVAEALTAASLGTALVARRSRTAAVLSGTALVASSALTRLGIFEAGMASARDPKYTIRPQAERARQALPSPGAGTDAVSSAPTRRQAGRG